MLLANFRQNFGCTCLLQQLFFNYFADYNLAAFMYLERILRSAASVPFIKLLSFTWSLLLIIVIKLRFFQCALMASIFFHCKLLVKLSRKALLLQGNCKRTPWISVVCDAIVERCIFKILNSILFKSIFFFFYQWCWICLLQIMFCSATPNFSLT